LPPQELSIVLGCKVLACRYIGKIQLQNSSRCRKREL
jgi:hypothetical protein